MPAGLENAESCLPATLSKMIHLLQVLAVLGFDFRLFASPDMIQQQGKTETVMTSCRQQTGCATMPSSGSLSFTS